jgi:hypothetical protein
MKVSGQPQVSVALPPGKKLSVGLRTDLDVLEKRKKQGYDTNVVQQSDGLLDVGGVSPQFTEG